jgi:hypothetical protein
VNGGEWTGAPVATTTALESLAKDQALGLMIEARRHQTSETLAAFARAGLLRWAYQDAAPSYYRYADVLEVRDGKLLLPGGPSSAALWQRLAGEAPASLRDFVPALLHRRDGRVAFLWQSLYEAPPEVARFYLGDESSKDEVRAVRRVLGKLDDTAQESFEAPYGGDLGFGTFVRSVPLDAAGKRLDLPGGAGLWWTAVRGEDAPDDPARLQRIVERGGAVQLDDLDLLLKVLNETVNLNGYDQPALPRLIGVVRRFGDRRDLLTPSNVVLLTRAADAYPAALRVLGAVAWTRPDVIRDYLLAVAALDRLPRTPNSELLVLSFQGGTELISRLGRGGRLPPAVLEEHLERWGRIHGRAQDPFLAAGEQLAWLDRVLSSLPASEPGAPGRGALEQALLQALAPTRDPQRFEVDGVAFVGERGLEARRTMAQRLVEQEVPSYDEIVGLGRTLRALRAACAEEKLDTVKALVQEAEAALRRFPPASFASIAEEKEILERVFPVDRPKILAALEDLRAVKKANRLSSRVDDVDRIVSWLARDLRVALVAPTYLTIMARSASPAFESPNLLRSHRLWEDLKLATVSDSAWQATRIEAGKAGGLGASLRGPLSGAASALAEYADIGSAAEEAGKFEDLNRIRLVFAEWLSADWESISPEVSREIARLIEAGESELRRDPKSAHCRAVVPAQRLEHLERTLAENGALAPEISWSERLAIGIAVSGRPVDPALHVAGVASLSVNGQGQPWIGRWPSYEQLSHERRTTSLEERSLADFKLAVVRYLGRRGLQGVVASELMAMVVADMRAAATEGPRDWQSWVRFTSALDDDRFDAAMRTALERGLYSLE